MNTINIPVGTSNFAEIRRKGSYFIDKSSLIEQLLKTQSTKVTLITRPRRFGKTLGMSMLSEFFDIQKNSRALFEGLSVMKNKGLCRQWMNQYPTLFLSFRSVDGLNFSGAYAQLASVIAELYKKHIYLAESERIQPLDKEQFHRTAAEKADLKGVKNSLLKLTQLMELHYQKPVILIIDEYDVPLAKAHANGYYDQMLSLIRSLLGEVLKTNSSLKLAVLTGCLRISKESIFTGLNNLKVLTIADERFDEYFGFTDKEVKDLLEYYSVTDHYEEVKRWYDGYQFGNKEVYCPWDVLNHCDRIRREPHVQPENYWINTSSNDAVKKFIQMSDNLTTKREIEKLLAGEEIIKEIHQELIYPEMYQSLENVWSLLFMTGYLTQRGRVDAKRYKLAIPNLEIRDIFETQIMEYFKESVAKDGDTLSWFCDALKNGEETKVGEIFESYLKKAISIRDTFVRKASKENFYHGILLGILGVKEGWGVFSNQETGEGYIDILIETENSEIAILIEVKYANDGDLDQACERALKQVEERKYDEELRANGADKILKYGIACYMKRCKVKLAGE